ncbi:amidohydrolase family protein [Arthrobacter sp. YN]|uniref:amidohydrolase family protein n=1 Tax=Arthrobacter sp. YN TaxID=2020486 RepID=UPI000B5EDFBC|nr:amidohydrolase family protein [Arthrobacter sp. YN]ASN20076.1 amidohydrolase [Arthrobacter sp. YN]
MSDSLPFIDQIPDPIAMRIDGACIYTGDVERPVLLGSLLTAGGTITALGGVAEVDVAEAQLAANGTEVRHVNGSGLMLMPGLVNNHWHSLSALRVAAAGGLDLDDRHDPVPPTAHGGNIPAITQEFAGLGSLMQAIPPEAAGISAIQSLVWQLRAGTTCVADFGSIGSTDTLVGAAQATGIRAALSMLTIDGIAMADGFVRVQDTDHVLQSVDTMVSDISRRNLPTVRPLPSVLGSVLASDELLKGIGEIAEKYDTQIGTHFAAWANENDASLKAFGKRPVDRYAAAGLLSPRLIAAHVAYLDDDEFQRIVAAGIHVTHAPARYGAMGEATLSQRVRVLDLIRANLTVGLSTDTDELPLGGMPEAMRMAWLGYNEAAGDPTFLPPSSVLAMATRAGAVSLAWDDKIGRIAPGMRADFVGVRVDDWRYAGVARPLTGFLSRGSSNDVDLVVVDGRVLISGGEFTFLDEHELQTKFLEMSAAVARAAAEANAGH